MKVLFVAGFGPIVQDMQAARSFYGEALGLPLEGDDTYTSVVHDQLAVGPGFAAQDRGGLQRRHEL